LVQSALSANIKKGITCVQTKDAAAKKNIIMEKFAKVQFREKLPPT